MIIISSIRNHDLLCDTDEWKRLQPKVSQKIIDVMQHNFLLETGILSIQPLAEEVSDGEEQEMVEGSDDSEEDNEMEEDEEDFA